MVSIKIDTAKKVYGDYSAYITFDYDFRLVEIMRTMTDKYYNAKDKEWEMSLQNLPSFLELADGYSITLTCDNCKDKFQQEKSKELGTLPDGFRYKTIPYEHQEIAVKYGLSHESWLLGDEAGLGKTKITIDIAVARKQKHNIKHCLIICGVNGLKYNWLNEIHTHSNESAWILGTTHQSSISKKSNTITTQTKIEDLNVLLSGIPDVNHNEIYNAYFIITNIESLRNEEICKLIKKCCDRDIISMIAVDEAHKCFDYNTPILTNMGIIKIGDIVSKKIPCIVLSYNEHTGLNEWKPVVDWHENLITDRLLELTIETGYGIKTIKCTKDHKFYTTNRGWVEAQYLTEDDDIEEF